MGHLSKFLRLPGAEKVLLLQAFLLLSVARIGLRTLPFAALRATLSRMSGRAMRNGAVNDTCTRQRIVRAVETVGRHFPAIGTCLTQALAAHVLLRRRGYRTNLRIGVTRDRSGKFSAHAWLEEEGAILIGEGWSKKYTPMPVLKGLEP